MKTHVKRKHTKFNQENFPKTCEFCETEVNDEKEMKSHLKTHSYKMGMTYNLNVKTVIFGDKMGLQWKFMQEKITLLNWKVACVT